MAKTLANFTLRLGILYVRIYYQSGKVNAGSF